MTAFPWFPIGHQIACGTVGRLRAEGAGYQVLHDQSSERLMLVIASDSSAGKGAAASSVATEFEGVDFGGRSFLALSMSKAEEPVPVLQWPKRFGLPTSPDIKAMGKAISDLRQRDFQAEVGSALFVPPIEVSRKDGHVGAVAFSRTSDPATGDFGDARRPLV
jgi:cell division protease FtsH